jgi:hypothetical protein
MSTAQRIDEAANEIRSQMYSRMTQDERARFDKLCEEIAPLMADMYGVIVCSLQRASEPDEQLISVLSILRERLLQGDLSSLLVM